MVNMDLLEVGENIRKQREFLGMSQEELALEIGTSKGTISLYESGQMAMKVDRLFEIADALFVTPLELSPERFNIQPDIDPRLFQIGEMVKATVVDHIIPHRGDQKLFWDQRNWQSLCKQCHDRKTLTEDIHPTYRY